MKYVWIFNGNGKNPFPSAVFSTKEKAEKWITEHKLSGTLTQYPIDISIFDWVIENNYYTPKDYHYQAKHIGNFSSAAQEHFHYEKGKID